MMVTVLDCHCFSSLAARRKSGYMYSSLTHVASLPLLLQKKLVLPGSGQLFPVNPWGAWSALWAAISGEVLWSRMANKIFAFLIIARTTTSLSISCEGKKKSF